METRALRPIESFRGKKRLAARGTQNACPAHLDPSLSGHHRIGCLNFDRAFRVLMRTPLNKNVPPAFLQRYPMISQARVIRGQLGHKLWSCALGSPRNRTEPLQLVSCDTAINLRYQPFKPIEIEIILWFGTLRRSVRQSTHAVSANHSKTVDVCDFAEPSAAGFQLPINEQLPPAIG
jgi:hypothetical protein